MHRTGVARDEQVERRQHGAQLDQVQRARNVQGTGRPRADGNGVDHRTIAGGSRQHERRATLRRQPPRTPRIDRDATVWIRARR
jgi:hypothetical protein